VTASVAFGLVAAFAVATAPHLTVDSTISDVVGHRAFAGQARLLLPWDDRQYDPNMRLTDIGSLLPYHSDVDAKLVVAGFNHMIDEVHGGRKVFFDFDPARPHTGLFLFRGKPGAPFALIAPGGGFSYVGSVHEGFPYAMEISQRGYNAFVLKYRAGMGQAAATEDMARALSWIFRNASELGVGIQDYSLWGSSAGARMAAAIGSHGVARFGGDVLPKPSTVVMAYTAHSDYTRDEPPSFVVVGSRDSIAPPATMERRVAALRAQGTAVDFHNFANVGHGFGPGTGTSAEGWIGRATQFWERHMRRSG
jgi:acetyl esterase/lipase